LLDLAHIWLKAAMQDIMPASATSLRRSIGEKSYPGYDPKTGAAPNTPLEQIRVVIADDHPVARQGLSAILGSMDDIEVVAEATDGEEACQLYRQHAPDVLIVDIRMPKKDGLQVVEELMAGHCPKPRIIVITTYEDEEAIRRAVRAGAKGYLVKVAAGQSLFPTEITLKLVEAVACPELSKRERQVLEYLANGRSNKEIGAILYISELTVKGHVRSILEKLNAKGRSEAIAIAIKRGLIRANT
jgi:two-component system, NarL family, response regulator